MLACNETVTLVQHVDEQDADIYICTMIQGASWYDKVKVALQDHGLVAARETKIRIPATNMPAGVTPVEGNWMILGAVKEIAKQADLDAYEHIRIMAVGDNRRGGLPHWAVMGQ